eukprot:CAMPEP_0115110090 /NCGR_PEP_ID=MMETSP0227-20121206/39161_1 /TAXON_ID=89957 /ORGANISM="Polarella glacialis, Strain CCMP 1383" /LENGTH=303 /DNA_ID=CAMNT_0002509047 /DNA_START=39 /DNA_END=947 /DNA_ORIENTATION=+
MAISLRSLCVNCRLIPSSAPVVGKGCRYLASEAGEEGKGRTKGRGKGAGKGGGKGDEDRAVRLSGPVSDKDVLKHMERLQATSQRMMKESGQTADQGKFSMTWRTKGGPGAVPYRFRIQDPDPKPKGKGKGKGEDDAKGQGKGQGGPAREAKPYADFAGLRFPTLETAENFDYHKDRGLARVIERTYPIKVPGYRRLDPYLREYIYFLHNLDPQRFTVSRICQRYRMREKTVAKVVQEWGANLYMTRTGLCRLNNKQTTREAVILGKKEEAYGKWVGWDQLGDDDDPETDDEELGEFKGWRST